MLKPKILTKENCSLLDRYKPFMNPHKAISSPTMLCLWKDYLGIELCEKDGFLYIFEREHGNIAYTPVGNGDFAIALKNIKEYQQSVNGKTMVVGINEDELPLFRKLGIEPVENDERHEYVYLRENLALLPGKKYHKKRNHINKFTNQYNYTYERVDEKNIHEINDFIDKWFYEKKDELTAELSHEKNVLINFITFIDHINYKACLLKVNGEIAAFSAGEKLADDMGVIYFEKAIDQYKGAYPVINQQFIVNEFKDVKYINRQEDLGIEGLRKAKKSYYPEFMVKNYYAQLID